MDEPSGKPTLWDRLKRIHERTRSVLPFVAGIAATMLGLVLYNYFFPADQLTEREVNAAIANAMASATPRPAFSAEVYQIIQPSLVLIQTEGRDENGGAANSLGTGVIIDEFGHVLTSLHVVRDARRIKVTFADGTQSEAFIEIAQPENDIAVLSAVTLPELYLPAVMGNPGAMRVGDEVYVVGNPFGLYGSMSAGVLSGFNRTFRPPDSDLTIQGLIQFDAAANPGNSGGPLLNRSGHVIGIVTGIVNPTDESFFVGIGFAVPIGTAAGGLGAPPY